jgi:hypothetical protein
MVGIACAILIVWVGYHDINKVKPIYCRRVLFRIFPPIITRYCNDELFAESFSFSLFNALSSVQIHFFEFD